MRDAVEVRSVRGFALSMAASGFIWIMALTFYGLVIA